VDREEVLVKQKTAPSPEKILAWGRVAGVTDEWGRTRNDVRYVAHEAAHALELEIGFGGWSSDAINDAACDNLNEDMVLLEANARAVEWIVCEAVGECYDAMKWATISCMEAIHNRVAHIPRPAAFLQMIENAKGTAKVKRWAKKILAAGARP
jgi:hypothetical protein